MEKQSRNKHSDHEDNVCTLLVRMEGYLNNVFQPCGATWLRMCIRMYTFTRLPPHWVLGPSKDECMHINTLQQAFYGHRLEHRLLLVIN